jgi:hypothetical protein
MNMAVWYSVLATLLVVARLCECNVELDCERDLRWDSYCGFHVKDIDSMDECGCFLKNHSSIIAAVSFDMVNKQCYAVPVGASSHLVNQTDWLSCVLEVSY